MFIPQISLLIVSLHLVIVVFILYFGIVLGKLGVGSGGDGNVMKKTCLYLLDHS